jgi:hypothetical protein
MAHSLLSYRQIQKVVTEVEGDREDENYEPSFWEELEFLTDVLGLIYSVMRKTDSATPIMGKLYHYMHRLGDDLEALTASKTDANEEGKWAVFPFSQRMPDILELHLKRWEYMHCDYHSAGFALDPNFLDVDVNNVNNGEVYRGVEAVMKKFFRSSTEKQQLALEQYNEFRELRGNFSSQINRALARKLPAHEWWDKIGGELPELRMVACHVLSKTSSASATERNWSAFEAVQTPKRVRLLHGTLNDLVFARSNLRLIQKREDPNFKEKVAEWVDEQVFERGSDAGSGSESEAAKSASSVHSDSE